MDECPICSSDKTLQRSQYPCKKEEEVIIATCFYCKKCDHKWETES